MLFYIKKIENLTKNMRLLIRFDVLAFGFTKL